MTHLKAKTMAVFQLADQFDPLSRSVDDGAANFLRSINFVLGTGDYEPTLFTAFRGVHPNIDRPGSLQRAIVDAYNSIKDDPDQASFIQNVVWESFKRTLCMPLGARRTRVVADVVHAITPERIQPTHWQVLWQRDPERNPSEWWSQLIPRFLEWGVDINLTRREREDVINKVTPESLESAVIWLSKTLEPGADKRSLRTQIIERMFRNNELAIWRTNEEYSLIADRILKKADTLQPSPTAQVMISPPNPATN